MANKHCLEQTTIILAIKPTPWYKPKKEKQLKTNLILALHSWGSWHMKELGNHLDA